MTVSHIGTAHHAEPTQRRAEQWDRPDRRVDVGQTLDLRVVRRLAEHRYLVSFGGEQHIVETAMALTAGRTVRTTVAAVGEKLELKYVGVPAEVPGPEEIDASASEGGGDLIAELEARHAVSLNDAQRAAIERAMTSAAQPELIAAGGLYLSKLALPVGADALNALHDAQVWTGQTQASAAGATAAASFDLADLKSIEPLAAALKQLFDGAKEPPAGAGSAVDPAAMRELEYQTVAMRDLAGSDVQQDRGRDDLARQLLNEQDGGSLAYHYGVLPILIADQLVELDVVFFRERVRSERSANTRRLVMTFKTERLGRVEIEARAVADRLTVQIASDSSQSSSTLAEHVADVTDLLSRLGWDVDAVKYEFEPSPLRAAKRVIAHVLNSETLDRWV